MPKMVDQIKMPFEYFYGDENEPDVAFLKFWLKWYWRESPLHIDIPISCTVPAIIM